MMSGGIPELLEATHPGLTAGLLAMIIVSDRGRDGRAAARPSSQAVGSLLFLRPRCLVGFGGTEL